MGRRSRNQREVDFEKLISKMKKLASPPLRIGKDDLLARARHQVDHWNKETELVEFIRKNKELKEELKDYQKVFAVTYGFGKRATMDLIARIYIRSVLDLGPNEEHREKMAICLAELKERVKARKEEKKKKKEEEKIRKEEEEKRTEEKRMRKEEEEKKKEEERMRQEEEMKRKGEERMRQEEEKKRKEEERMRKEEEEKRKEEERIRQEEEMKRKEEERMRQEEEMKRKEEERMRQEEEMKRKEEERMRQEEEMKRKEEERMRKEKEEKRKKEKRIKEEEEEIRKLKNQMKKILVELKIVIQRKRENIDLFVPRHLFLFSIDIMKEIPKKDSTTKAQQSPRIPKDVSESDNGPVEKTEKHVSVEGPVAETGRQERPLRRNWGQRILRFLRRCF
ncbi:uncharacterized protein LOC111135101 [Crassostrea virginica]